MRIGIYLNNNVGIGNDPDAFSVHDNFINSTTPHSYITTLGYYHYGIWANSVSWISIGSNDIYRNSNLTGASSNFENLMLGMNLKQVQNCQIGYNHISDYGTSFRVLGNCNGSYFHCNQMHECVGFRLVITAMTSQGSLTLPSDNKWELFPTPFSNTFNRVDGIALRVNWYHKDDFNSMTFSNDYSPSPVNQVLIQDFPFINGSSCYQDENDNSMVISKLHDIITGSISYSDDSIESNLIDKEYAYKLLARDSAILNLDPLFKLFYDEYSVLNDGQFFKAENFISHDELDSALAQLNLISNPETIEQYKVYSTQMAIQERKEIESDWNESQLDSLNEIAYTDAWRGGSAVFNARHLLFAEIDDRKNNLKSKDSFETIESNGLSVFPNPANESLTIFTGNSANQTYSIELIDLTGRILLTQNLLHTSISTSGISSGIYILKILTNEKPIQIIKIEISH